MAIYNDVSIKVSGNLACFTRPESKVERFSYPIMTPSAAVGVLEAIYWHPQFYWRVDQIAVLKRGDGMLPIMRNEVKYKMGTTAASLEPLIAPKHHTQRQTVYLKNVEYVIRATQIMHPEFDRPDKRGKAYGIFQDRLKKSQQFHHAYLGLRECMASCSKYDWRVDGAPIDWTEHLGPMFYGFDYQNDRKAMFFDAYILNGVMTIPDIQLLRHNVS